MPENVPIRLLLHVTPSGASEDRDSAVVADLANELNEAGVERSRGPAEEGTKGPLADIAINLTDPQSITAVSVAVVAWVNRARDREISVEVAKEGKSKLITVESKTTSDAALVSAINNAVKLLGEGDG